MLKLIRHKRRAAATGSLQKLTNELVDIHTSITEEDVEAVYLPTQHGTRVCIREIGTDRDIATLEESRSRISPSKATVFKSESQEKLADVIKQANPRCHVRLRR